MSTTEIHKKNKVLILGIGNELMGDEGIGVRVANELETAVLPAGVEVLDGGTGCFLLLEPMQNAEKVILIDATIDGKPAGTIRRLRPKYSADYPPTLTAHDIGLKDLLDAFYLMGRDAPEVSLYAISIPPLNKMTIDMSPELEEIIPLATELVTAEARAATGH
jgi:hydrogenase maturation protease